jgi:hypothetical protein
MSNIYTLSNEGARKLPINENYLPESVSEIVTLDSLHSSLIKARILVTDFKLSEAYRQYDRLVTSLMSVLGSSLLSSYYRAKIKNVQKEMDDVRAMLSVNCEAELYELMSRYYDSIDE